VRSVANAPPTSSSPRVPERSARSPSLAPATLAVQRAAGNRAAVQFVARFKKGLTQTTIEQVRGLSIKKQVDFLIAVSKGEQVAEAEEEVRDLHRALVLNGLGRAGNRVKPYAPDSAFARDVKVLEDLGDKLLAATLDQADVTALIRALRTVEKEPETAPAAEAAPDLGPMASPLSPAITAAPVAAPQPKKEPEKPKGPPALNPSMGPANVEEAIKRYSEGGTDDAGAPVVRAWDTWTMYVSSWDKPSSVPGGKSDAWGFSTSHVLAGLVPQKANLKGSTPAEAGKQKWIIHVHRTEAGAIKAATVQWADLEGAGGEKSTLTAKQLTRIGVPATVDWRAKTASGENKVPGVYKYQRFSK
jgi:hypothetical protein